MKPTRIALISHSGNLLGAEKALLALASGLNRDEFDPLVFLPAHGVLEERLLTAEVPFTKFSTHPWSFFAGWHEYELAHGFGRGLGTRVDELAGKLRAANVDLVYSNTIVVAEGALAAAALRVPHVWHVHEPFRRFDFYAHAAGADLLELSILRLSDCVVGPSDYVLQDFTTLDRSRLTLVHEPVNVGDYSGVPLAQTPPSGGPFRVLCLGEVSRRKGQFDLVEALCVLPPQMISATELWFAGPMNDRDYHSRIVRRIRESGLEDRVRFLGFRSDVPDLLRQADVMVLPTHCDAFPLVLLEAMAAGRPVVTTRSGGAAESVLDGVTGLLVDVAAPAQLAAALQRLFGDPDLRLRLGKAGRERALLFDSHHFTDAFRIRFRELRDHPPSSDTMQRRADFASWVVDWSERASQLLDAQRSTLVPPSRIATVGARLRNCARELTPPVLWRLARHVLSSHRNP